MASVPMRCNCTSNTAGNTAGAKSQDKLYGKGMRLHNSMENSLEKFRCTVCGTERGRSTR